MGGEGWRLSTTISSSLIAHVRVLYELALRLHRDHEARREGINVYTSFALPAYISAVAALEAFVNEFLFHPISKGAFQDSALWQLDQAWVENLELARKLIIAPQLLFGRSLKRDHHTFRDTTTLIKVRNDIVHYKMNGRTPGYMAYFAQEHIALHPDSGVWVDNLSSSEGIRWANNTACTMVHMLVGLIPEAETSEERSLLAQQGAFQASAFEPITEAMVNEAFSSLGINPTSHD